MNEKTVSEGASLPRSSAKVLRRVLSAAAVLFALCLVLAAPAVAEGGPDMTGNTILVNASNAQDVLDGKYGSIAGKTIHFTENIPDVLELARPTKYEGSGTVYYNYVNYQLETEPTPWSESISTTMNSHSHYYRTLQNVTFTAANDVTVAGFNFSAGHVASSGYDYVRDVEQTEGVTYYKYSSLDNITFKDLTITGQFDASLYLEDSSVQDITFDGCTFTGTTDDGSNAAIKFLADNQYFENIVVKDCNIDGYYQGVYISGVNGAEIIDNVINNTGHNAIALQSESNPAKGTINVKENFLNNIGDRAIRFNYVSADAVITINNNIMVNAGNSGNQLIKAEGSSSNSVNLENNYWNGIALTIAVQTFYVPTAVGVSGGTWDTDVSAYVAEGYQCVEEGGSYIVREADPVAQIGETGYTSLQKAVDAAEENAEIVLITDVTDVTLAVPADKKITLELNGKTITGVYDNQNKGSFVIKNQGHLTINDSIGTGAIVSNVQYPDATYGYGNNAIDNFGTLVVNSGTIKVITDGAGSLVAIDSREGASLIVNGGNISSKKNAIRLAPFTSNEVLITSAVINGGSITGNRGIQIHLPSSTASVAQQVTLEINDGIISSSSTSDSRLAIYSYSYGNGIDNVTITIRNGTINGDVAFTGGSNKNPAENVTVTGGIFNGFDGAFYSYADDEVAKETMSVTGGWFNNKTYVEYYLANGYACVEEDGGYAVKKAWKVIWLNDDQSEISNETVAEGTILTAPEVSKDADVEYSYAFAGWLNSSNVLFAAELPAVTGEETYTANFTATPIVYNISFHIDAAEYAYLSFPFGADLSNIDAVIAEEITTPEKIGYTFTGWDISEIPGTMPTWDITLKSGFVINTYNITFIVDGTEYKKIEQEYNSAVTAPENPEKIGHEFAGWTPAVPETMPAVNQTVTAQWNINAYNITFVDGEAELSTIQTNFNSSIAGAIADVSAPTKTGYTFIGWNLTGIPELMPAEDITIPVEWKVNQYTITFDTKGGNELAAVKKDYNTSVVEADLPTPEMIGYTFAGWNETFPFLMPAEDIELEAKWTPIKYLITWVNDTATLKTEEVAYGETPVFGDDTPTKENTNEYSYAFVGWEPEIVPVAGEATYKANFTATPIPYTVSFVVDGEECSTLTYGFNESLENIGEDIKAEITDPEKLGHTFIGWNLTALPKLMPAENLIVPAEWKVNQYNITLDTQGGNALSAVKKDYNTSVAEADLPTPEKTGYTFAGWNTTFPFLMPAEDIELEAKWTVNEYTVIWYNYDGKTQLSKEQVAFNSTPIYHGAIPTKPEDDKFTYTFAGWEPTVSKVPVGGSVYKAVFTEVAKVIKEEDITKENITVEPEIAPEIEKKENSKEVTIIVTPSAPSIPDDGEGDGAETPETPTPTTTTIVDTGKKSATIVDSNSGVKMEIGFTEAPKVTTDETTGKTGVTGEIKMIKVTYPVKAAEVTNKVDKPAEKPVTQEVVIKLKEIKELPTISSEFNESVEKDVQKDLGSDQKALAMITASHDNLDTINANIDKEAGDGIVVTFTIPKDLVDKIGGKGKLKVFHVKNQKAEAMDNDRISVKLNDAETHYIVEVKADGFSSYVVGYEEEQEYNDYYDDEDDTPATPVTPEKPEDKPTETPSDEPSDDPTDVPGDAPSDIPGSTPSEPGKSPAPILGVLAALGAAVVLRRK